MKKEFDIFLTAIMFFTRIPCPNWVDHSKEILNKSTRYFALVGIIVGAFGGTVYYGANIIFDQNLAIVFSMMSTIWITGAFHEDGFADMLDGFGGGWTKEKILTIMKDSRLGTYGTIGLIFLLATKFLSLQNIHGIEFVFLLIAGHSVSRFFATILIYKLPYVRDDGTGKEKPSADNMQLKSLILNALFGLLPLFLFQEILVFIVLIPCAISTYLMGRFFNKWIGGHTGDCAGATQQIVEIVFYLSMIVLWKTICIYGY